MSAELTFCLNVRLQHVATFVFKHRM